MTFSYSTWTDDQLRKNLQPIVDKCPCRSCKPGDIRDRGLYSTLPIPQCANSVLYVDYTEMPKFGGYEFTLVVTCGLTRFTRVFPCTKHITGEETIKILLKERFCVYGAPKEINSDEDVRVCSDTGWYKRFLGSLNVQVSTGIPYSHTSNPLCERQIPVLKENVRIWCKTERTRDWVRLLPVISLMMTSQESLATGYSPHQLFLGGGRGAPSTKERPTAKQKKKKKTRGHEEPRGGRKKKNAKHSAKAQGTRGRKPEKARDNGGAEKEKKNTRNGAAKQSRKPKRDKERVRRTRTRPGGRPARPGQEEQAHAHTRGTRAWRPPTRKGRCRRPHETAPVHRPSPPLNDARSGKPDASVTGSTHANHRSARSPRPTLEGPARDNPIAGPRAGTTRSEPSAPALAGASGRHKEPGSRPASACPVQPLSKAEGASPRVGERHHGDGKADRSTESDRTRRGAAYHAGPQGTPERHAGGHNQGTRTGAKQRRPSGATNLESAHNTQRTTAQKQVPGKRSAHTSTHTAQHPSQEWRGAGETQAQTHTPTPRTSARSGWVQAEHTQSPTPQPGVAGRS